MLEIISRCPIFEGLRPGELELLFSGIHHFTKSFQVGELVALNGEPCNYLLCLLEGKVKAEMIDFSGKIIKIEDLEAPQALAAAFLFGRENKFPVNIIASDRTKIMYIPRHDLLKMMQGNLRILQNYLNNVSSRAQFLSEKIRFLSFKTIKGKISQYILKLAGNDKDMIELPISQQTMAEMFGVTRPALARAIGEMAADGILTVDRRIIRILDRRRLVDLMK